MDDTNVTNARGSKTWTKFVVLVVVVAVIGVSYVQFRDWLALDSLAAQEVTLRQYQVDSPWFVLLAAFLLYVTVTGLSLPGATALTLVYAWYFDFVTALVLVSFASTAGATLAFLLSRYLFREAIQNKFGEQLAKFNDALDREGAFYLFTLRLIPAVPFFVINVVMGLTRIRVATFWWVSQVGMFAGTIVFVYAGSTIPSLSHLADPSQLRSGDVLDWNGLIQELRADDSPTEPASRMRELLSNDTRTLIDGLEGEPDNDAKVQIIADLNRLIGRADFSLREPWRSAFQAVEEAESRRKTHKQLTKINRDILVAVYPHIISPPRPILSKQLILAFVILGFFPLVVKKIMQRFRQTPVVDDAA